ncbi:MAG: 4Fe-4S binding protein [Candidatus Cloacimonetes bacterium]|nr:4Fe-4S binding protein [Candidatus Cloacimonadota bacterium]
MSKKILIDLSKFRFSDTGQYNYGECIYDFHPHNTGMKDVIERAMLEFACRRCEDAPCIAVCPEEALERDENGAIHRATNLCVGCQSCVAVCPFGTLMNEIITAKKAICDLTGCLKSNNPLKCLESAPEGAITLTDQEADPENHIYQLDEHILVKEFRWQDLIDNGEKG